MITKPNVCRNSGGRHPSRRMGPGLLLPNLFAAALFLGMSLFSSGVFAEEVKGGNDLRDKLVTMLSGYEYIPSESEVKALGPDVPKVLMEIASDDKVMLFRQVRAVALLGYFPDKGVSAYLKSVVQAAGQKRILMRTGLQSLARCGGKETVGFISEYLRSEDRFVRGAAIEALGMIPEPEVMGVLERSQADETEPFLKEKYEETLSRLRTVKEK